MTRTHSNPQRTRIEPRMNPQRTIVEPRRSSSSSRDDGQRRAHRRFRSQHQRAERYALPSGSHELFALLIRPAPFRANQYRRTVVSLWTEGGKKWWRAGLLVAPQPVSGMILQSLSQFDRRVDFRNPQPPRLFAGFLRDAPPPFHAFLAAFEQAALAALAATGTMRVTPSSVAFSTAHSKRSNLISARYSVTSGAGGPASSSSMTSNSHQIASRAFTLASQTRLLSVISYFALSHAKDASEMMRAFALDFARRRCGPDLRKIAVVPCTILRYPFKPKMIALLRGTLIEKHPNQAIIDVGRRGIRRHDPCFHLFEAAGRGVETRSAHPYSCARRHVRAVSDF